MSLTPRSVLVVDDTDDMRFLLRRLLERDARFTVAGEADDGKAALALLDARGCPDLVLLDLMMPGMDGFAALPLIRARCPGTKVVVFSAVRERSIIDRAHALGAVAHLVKGTDIGELLDDLARIP